MYKRSCVYGKDCLSRNPVHYLRVQHPEPDESPERFSSSEDNEGAEEFVHVIAEKGRMADKLKKAAPYNIFLTAVTDSEPTHSEPLTVTFQELLDESLGEIECAAHISNLVGLNWLLKHYRLAGLINVPLLIVYGNKLPHRHAIGDEVPTLTVVKSKVVRYAQSYAKIALFGYRDGSMRVVIMSNDLIPEDWDNSTQNVWISPHLKRLPDNDDGDGERDGDGDGDGCVGNGNGKGCIGESPTNFREDLAAYLTGYKLPELDTWIERIRKSDCTAVNVFLVTSVPGEYREGVHGYPYGHCRLSYLLRRHCTVIDPHVPIVCQSPVLATLGWSIRDWTQHNLLNSLRKDSRPFGIHEFPPFKMIFPSVSNVKSSHDGILGGLLIRYATIKHTQQLWLLDHLHQWVSNSRFRTKALPGLKTYTRFSVEQQCVYWFVLSSANVTKPGWGTIDQDEDGIPTSVHVNYEAGVLFLPRFVTGEETFPLGVHRNGVPPFPLPYDVPLVPYGPNDTPFLIEDAFKPKTLL